MENVGELKAEKAEDLIRQDVMQALNATTELQDNLNPQIESLGTEFNNYMEKLDHLKGEINENLSRMSYEEMRQKVKEMRMLAVNLRQELVAADNSFEEFFKKINLNKLS
jgi:hypothetical protein